MPSGLGVNQEQNSTGSNDGTGYGFGACGGLGARGLRPCSEVAWFTIRASIDFIDGIVVDKDNGWAVAMHSWL